MVGEVRQTKEKKVVAYSHGTDNSFHFIRWINPHWIRDSLMESLRFSLRCESVSVAFSEAGLNHTTILLYMCFQLNNYINESINTKTIDFHPMPWKLFRFRYMNWAGGASEGTERQGCNCLGVWFKYQQSSSRITDSTFKLVRWKAFKWQNSMIFLLWRMCLLQNQQSLTQQLMEIFGSPC